MVLCQFSGDVFIHFDRRKKKFSLLKCIQKSNVILKNWVLVFSFMYLVLVDAMDWSLEVSAFVLIQPVFIVSTGMKFAILPWDTL